MSKYFLALQKVHDIVHDFEFFEDKTTVMKKKFSEPKIYTGGVDIKEWNKKALELNKLGFTIKCSKLLENCNYSSGTDLADVYFNLNEKK